MTRLFKHLFMVVLATAINVIFLSELNAQQNNKQRMTRDELAEVQAKHIASELAFDDPTTLRFIETYKNYQKEIWNLGPRAKKKNRIDSQTSTEQDLQVELNARFEKSQKILDIRKKYYNEYSKFLTQKQIQRVYEIEKDVMKRLSKHAGKNKR